MQVAQRPHREGAVRGAEVDVGRRRFLLALVGLPLAAQGALGLAGCSGGEDAAAPEAPGAGASPVAPEPAAKPAGPAGTAGASPGPEPAGRAAAGGAQPQAPPGEALVTEVEAMRPTVQALQYVNASTRPDQRCASCQFYTAKTAERGACQLFAQGLVQAGGWCTSWTKRVDA